MGKMLFKYGAMGSSKTAQALITRFNYLENGMNVWLIKPAIDTRDGQMTIKSRIGLSAEADAIHPEEDIHRIWTKLKKSHPDYNIVIADESQFFTVEQIEQLRTIADEGAQVWCFGLKTNFQSKLFEGSKRLIELADSIEEIKTVCSCGAKATINARLDENGHVIVDGDELLLGGNNRYKAMCHACWVKAQRK